MLWRTSAGWLAALAFACNVTAASAPLDCSLSGPMRVAAGQTVQLQWTLTNRGPQALDVLRWATPLEPGWFGPYLSVLHGTAPLSYGGPSAKRADPQAGEYVHLAPGASTQAVVELNPVFDLSRPGRYTVQPRIVLHDVVIAGQGSWPRPREQHRGMALACPSLAFSVHP